MRQIISCLLLVYVLFSPAYSLAAKKADIKIDITTHLGDVHDFNQGDTVSFLVSINRDAYVVVIYETANGELIQLVPNAAITNNFYKAGLYITIPEPDSGFVFKIQAPFGKERLWAFASASQVPDLKGDVLSNGLKKLQVNINEIVNKLNSNAQSFGQTQYSLQTHRLK